MSGESFRLDDDQLERLAELVAERLDRSSGTTSRWVDARELARRLGVNRAFVYQHALELGGVRIGPGARGRLRFDAVAAMYTMQGTRSPRRSEDSRAARRPRRPKTGPERRPLLEPTATWDSEAGLWKDREGMPTYDQCWRSTGLGIAGLVAEGPNGALGATHDTWEAARREARKKRRQSGTRTRD